MTEAAAAMLDFGFGTLSANRKPMPWQGGNGTAPPAGKQGFPFPAGAVPLPLANPLLR